MIYFKKNKDVKFPSQEGQSLLINVGCFSIDVSRVSMTNLEPEWIEICINLTGDQSSSKCKIYINREPNDSLAIYHKPSFEGAQGSMMCTIFDHGSIIRPSAPGQAEGLSLFENLISIVAGSHPTVFEPHVKECVHQIYRHVIKHFLLTDYVNEFRGNIEIDKAKSTKYISFKGEGQYSVSISNTKLLQSLKLKFSEDLGKYKIADVVLKYGSMNIHRDLYNITICYSTNSINLNMFLGGLSKKLKSLISDIDLHILVK